MYYLQRRETSMVIVMHVVNGKKALPLARLGSVRA